MTFYLGILTFISIFDDVDHVFIVGSAGYLYY